MLYIVLPAYNEEEGIEVLLSRIDRITRSFDVEYQMIVVNDGSEDHTELVVRSFMDVLSVELINLTANSGIQKVFETAFNHVLDVADDNDVCISMDSDNTQNPYVIMDLLEKINTGSDVVVASRFAPGGQTVGAPILRRLLSRAVSILMDRIFGIQNIKDYSSFYRAYRVRTIREVWRKFGNGALEGEGFAAMAGLLVKLGSMGFEMAEVPLVLRYDLKEGGSKIRIFRSIKGYLRIIYNHWKMPLDGP